MTPAVSVIIPTRNRKHLLREALEALSRQTLPPDRFEVIVIDNCSDDGTEQAVEALAPSLPFRFTYRRNEANQGPVYSRNKGFQMAQAPAIAFTDDDCAPSPGWLESGLAALADPGVGLVSGPTVNKPGQKMKFFSIGAVDVPAENPIYPTCNMLYRRAAIEQVGGLNLAFGFEDFAGLPLECGDVDLAWRVLEIGWESRYVPAATVYHEVRQVSPYQWLAGHVRVMTIPILIHRHPGLREKIIWWGPFARPENLMFHFAVAGVLAAPFTSGWTLLLGLLFAGRIAAIFGRGGAFLRLPRFLAQMVFVTLRQAVICASLLYGSYRARTLIL